MTAICASHYRNPLNDYVGKKHHHKNRFRQRQSSRSAFYQPGLRVMESRNSNEEKNSTTHSRQPLETTTASTTTSTATSASDSSLSSIPEGHWGFRPSALQYEDYGKGDMSVSEIVDWYVRDNERAEREGVSIPPRPTLNRRRHHKHVRDALFSASTCTPSSPSALRCLQWNIQAFLSPKDERNMHTITPGIIRSICETDSDVLILNEIHWREMENHNPNTNLYQTQQAISNSQALLEEVLRLRGYRYSRIANHGDTPTMVATRKRVLQSKELVLSDNRSALCLLLETGGSQCWVVGTHLDAFDAPRRRNEITRLLQEHHHPTKAIPILIAGDFNQQRSRDYTCSEWKRVVGSAGLRNVPLDDGVASILEKHGFRCILDDVRQQGSETQAKVTCNWDQTQPPPSTHWSGTTIDYTYYCNPSVVPPAADQSFSTVIAPQGVYVGPSGFSDHRPTVTDWTLTTTTKPSNAANAKAPMAPRQQHMDKTVFFHHLPKGRHHSWLYSYKHRHSVHGSSKR